jgi:hypothetical protein
MDSMQGGAMRPPKKISGGIFLGGTLKSYQNNIPIFIQSKKITRAIPAQPKRTNQ